MKTVLQFNENNKGKVIPVYAMKAFGGRGGTARLILNLSTRWRCEVSFMPQSLYLWEKSSCYPLHRWLGGHHRQSGQFREKSIYFPCYLNPSFRK
jgi:hypothetical protein